MSMTDTQIEALMTQLRKEYAAGRLPQWKIDRLEKIAGWEWGVAPGQPQPQAIAEDLLIRAVLPEEN